MKRLTLHNFSCILCLTYIYYKTDLKKLFIILLRLLKHLLYLKNSSSTLELHPRNQTIWRSSHRPPPPLANDDVLLRAGPRPRQTGVDFPNFQSKQMHTKHRLQVLMPITAHFYQARYDHGPRTCRAHAPPGTEAQQGPRHQTHHRLSFVSQK
jgi:hypothetical protein